MAERMRVYSTHRFFGPFPLTGLQVMVSVSIFSRLPSLFRNGFAMAGLFGFEFAIVR